MSPTQIHSADAPRSAASRLRRFVSIALPVAVSAVLIVWILGSIDDPEQILASIRDASLPLLLAIIPVSFLSHWLRATRWRRFLGGDVSRFYSFTSVMLGYAVNLVIPRGGEVARVVNMNRTTATPYPSLVATLLAERVLDVILLLAFLGVALLIEGPRIDETFPIVTKLGPGALLLATLGVFGVALLAFAGDWIVRVTERLTTPVHAGLGRIVTRLATEAKDGFAFMREPAQACWVLIETLAIWMLYWAGLILGMQAFGILAEIGLAGGTVAFSLTSFSVMVPSQGAIGVYHKFGQDSLHLLYGVAPGLALAWVTVVHAILFVVVGGIGGAGVWLLQLARARRAGDSATPEGPAGGAAGPPSPLL